MIKVSIKVAVPDRQADTSRDGHFLCYTEDSPIPWDRKIFVVTDSRQRTWFCHEFGHTLNEQELRKVAQAHRNEYGENTKRSSELFIELVAARAGDLDELRFMLGKVDLRNP